MCNSAKSQRSMAPPPKAVPASTRINAPKASSSSAPFAPAVTPSEKNAAAATTAAAEGAGRGRRRRHMPKRGSTGDGGGGGVVDERMRISRGVKNLVKRIRMEQNLLDAYAGEGWNGRSRERIRPESELQRAQSQILRSKLALRDLIRDLDNLGLEGSLQESAFDEEGQIYHEDIFCSKCKSQEAVPDNDIILCDGACDRGFHQNCLDPPLATADIPPGDEGWLCSTCDFKVECLSHINDYLGTDFHVSDRWEAIFAAEAAKSAAGDSAGAVVDDWPSEDSDDDDYNPEKKATRDEHRREDGEDAERGEAAGLPLPDGSESEPEASSASDLGDEDDDKDDEDDDDSSSGSSDVSGDDLGGQESGESSQHEPQISPTVAEPVSEDVVSLPPLGKRQRNTVDYKQLNAQLFAENAGDGDSDDDAEWGPRGVKRRREGNGSASGEGSHRGQRQVPDGQPSGEQNQRRRRRKSQQEQEQFPAEQGADGTEPRGVLQNDEPDQQEGSAGRRVRGKRLPEAAVTIMKKEFESGIFFPTRAFKQDLSGRLGVTSLQVSRWFKNARKTAKRGKLGRGTSQSPTGSRREGNVEEIELTNGILVEKLDEVQLKLHHLRHTLEAIKVQPDAGPESGKYGSGGDLLGNGKRILYVPVANVVEKEAEGTPGSL